MNFKMLCEDDYTIGHSMFPFSRANLFGKRFHWLLTTLTTQPITWPQLSTVRPCDCPEVKMSIRMGKEEDLRDFEQGEHWLLVPDGPQV